MLGLFTASGCDEKENVMIAGYSSYRWLLLGSCRSNRMGSTERNIMTLSKLIVASAISAVLAASSHAAGVTDTEKCLGEVDAVVKMRTDEETPSAGEQALFGKWAGAEVTI